MTKQRFETALQQLTPRRREVLELFLAGKTDKDIGQSLFIEETTVRQHIIKICQNFGTSRRANLMALFAQYKPELLHKPIVTESQNQVSSIITASNTSTSTKQDTCITEYDPNFVGRDDAIITLDNLINKGAKIIQIIAPGGTGKTRLAQKYLGRKFKTVLEFPIAKETKDIASIESLLEEKLRQLGEEPGREFIVSLDRLKQKLQTQEIGILIDNLEPALDASGKFIEQHRSYVELLRILTDSSIKSITLITSREPLCESLDITLYKLPGLTIQEWHDYWHCQGIYPSILTEIHKVYGGNALAMKVLCNPIINDFNGDAFAYWQDNKTEENLEIEPVVANLITEQFERLAHINIDAYNLLCRMGCYRYQDVPTVSEAGLFCLLWDVTENQHKRIIKVLKKRDLIEFNNDEYWLHPVIRQEAIDRLRNSDDWEKANIKAGEFWTKSIKSVENIKDALTAFEPYYHYLNVQDFNLAAKTIVKQIDDKSSLAGAFGRLGIFNIMSNHLRFNIDKIQDKEIVAKLYNILGEFQLRSGDLHQAIKLFNKNIQGISEEKYNNFIQIDSLYNIGRSQEELGEIKEAINTFEKTNQICQNTDWYSRSGSALFHLAFLYSCLGIFDKSKVCIKNLEDDNLIKHLGIKSKGYISLYLAKTHQNLQNLYESQENYCHCIEYSKKVNFIQLLAKALTGLAELNRIKGDLTNALSYHQESIKILDEIGARCDLAEAYFQLALTYQKIGNKASSEEYFNKALYLWSPEQIDAPKQIERVLNAMNS